MNWTPYLIKSLKSWLKHDVFHTIVIVDWSSDIPIIDKVRKVDPNRSYVLRVDDKEKFSITKVRNTAIRFSLRFSPDYIMFVDADMEFIESLDLSMLDNESYFSGVRHSTGTAIFPASVFMKLNGYNETINFRGSDQQFYNEMIKLGMRTRREGMIDKMRHIRHPFLSGESDRTENYMSPKKWKRDGDMALQSCTVYYPSGVVYKEIV
jgi:glycosyltransferase involved in cell wall biosynthesis